MHFDLSQQLMNGPTKQSITESFHCFPADGNRGDMHDAVSHSVLIRWKSRIMIEGFCG